MKIKECDKISKIKTASNKAFSTKRKIEATVAKIIKKVIPKSKLLKDKISSPLGDNKSEGRVMVQSLKSKGESTKRPIKTNIGGTNAQSKRWKMMAKMRSRRNTLDWWKCYLDSCASYHTFFVREFLKNIEEDESTMDGNCNAGSVLLKQKGW